jgi:hypothetical protein
MISLSHRSKIHVFNPQGQFTHPVRRLRHYLPDCHIEEFHELDGLPQNDATFYIILSANPQAEFPKELEQLRLSDLPEDGFRLTTLSWNEKSTLIAMGGGLPGLIYAINELGENHLKRENDRYTIPELNILQKPALPYRLLWTWDHSTNWNLNQGGKQELGCFNNYMKPATGFLEDYERLVDFMSLNRISGVTIYGFLRDNHGGIEAAQALCRYAKERGVRILPGVGINAYGGIYWEGSHKYNLTNWLKENPHLRAKFDKPVHFSIPEFPELWFPDSSYTDAACPSKPENLAYHCEALAWLAETFDIGGINFETGDYGTCKCDDCMMRRKEDDTWSIKDMRLLYPKLFESAKSKKENLWLVTEMYWDNILDRELIDNQKHLPDDAIYQFCVNRSYWNTHVKTELTADYVEKMPRSNNVMRTHMGTQWHHERHALVAEDFAEMVMHMTKTGMKGATIFAETSPFHVVNEINYLAFAQFTYHADMTWEKFVEGALVPRLGGSEAAMSYLRLLTTPDRPSELKSAISEARAVGEKQTDFDVYRRWIWLQNRLFKQLEMLPQ